MANNNFPQITSVTSEALQAQIRNLLPSQEGFGTDLMAQNVIVPVIDLTSAADGSSVPQILQTSIAFGSQTAFSVTNSTSTLVSTTGFYRIFGNGSLVTSTGAVRSGSMSLTDGLAPKQILELTSVAAGGTNPLNISFDFVIFLAAGISLTCTASTNCKMSGSTRQIADINGTLVNPVGFNPQ